MRREPIPLLLVSVLVAFAVAGCAAPGLRPTRATPAVPAATASAAATTNAASWTTTLIAAQRDVERGRHAEADRALRDFAERAASASEATETMYWRAVFLLDPASPAGSLREAAGLLSRYLGAAPPLAHRTEATVLQRVATALTSARDAGGSRSAAADVAREAEAKAMKEELEQTKAELERIRKRLAPPPGVLPMPSSPDPE